ncbi:phasin family protein [Azospirillum oryzae]|nr:phasin family protein [Azospirillum oryzae]
MPGTRGGVSMRRQPIDTPAFPQLEGAFPIWSANTLLQNNFLERTEAILRMQSNLFGGFEAMSRNWLEHRQDDLQSALSTVERMGTVEDAAERSSLWNDWMADRLKRWSDEATAVMEQAQGMSRAIAEQASASASQDRPFHPRERRFRNAEGRREGKPADARG